MSSQHSSNTGPRGRINNSKRGLRKRRKRHRKFHQSQFTDRETTFFKAYDYTHNAIYYYDENNPDQTISHWERPEELLHESYLDKEWDVTLDPTTSHYFYTSRLWPQLVVWHVPNGIDKKRKAHLERKQLRLTVASAIVEDMIVTLENVQNQQVIFWPCDKTEENYQLNESWNGLKDRIEIAEKDNYGNGGIDNSSNEIISITASETLNENNEEELDDETSLLISVPEEEEAEIEEKEMDPPDSKGTEDVINPTIENQSNHANNITSNNTANTIPPLKLLDWVFGTEESNDAYETREETCVTDIVEAILRTLEVKEQVDQKKQQILDQQQIAEQEQMVEEQTEENELLKDTASSSIIETKDDDNVNENEKEEQNVQEEEEKKEEKKKEEKKKAKQKEDDTLHSALWVSMSNKDHTMNRKAMLRSVAQAITYASIGHLPGISLEMEWMSIYQTQLGKYKAISITPPSFKLVSWPSPRSPLI